MKKTSDLIFIILFILCLVLPTVTMEYGKSVKSEIDNEYLPGIEIHSLEDVEPVVTTYIDKRIGFRQQALWLYQKINDIIFGVMEHPVYMYGEEEYVYFKQSGYIHNFQHLNLDEEYAQEFSDALLGFQNYANEQGMDFIYFYIPDKESVYPEYYPKGINVYGDVSRTDQILNALRGKGVQFYFSKDDMIEAKRRYLVDNIKYDAGHWNHHGAFVSIRSLYELMQKKYPQLEVIEEDEFNIENIIMESLQVSQFEIYEAVPVYSLKESAAIDKTEELRNNIELSFPDDYVCHYENLECEVQPKLLIFGDSYLAGYDDFFKNHFNEYTYIHRYNVLNQEAFEYYLEKIKPDIVIFENPERSHKIDLNQERQIGN